MNTGKLLRVSLLFGIVLALVFPSGAQASSQANGLSQPPARPQVTILQTAPASIEILVQFPGEPIFKPGDTGVIFDEALYSHPTEVGAPDLPVLNESLEVSPGESFEIEILNLKSTVTALGDNNLPAEIPDRAPEVEKCESGEVCENEDIEDDVQTSGLYPESVAKITNTYIMRGHQIAQLQFSPVQYDPAQGTVEIFEEVHLTLHINGAGVRRAVQDPALSDAPAFDEVLSNQVLNYEAPAQGGETRSKANEGYVIIAPDAFLPTLSALVDLKQSQGFSVTLTGLSAIGDTPESIKAYLHNAYHTWPVPPTYALLVGDVANGANTMPAFVGESSQTVTDLWYGTVDGADWIPDIFIGRLPARTTTQLTTMINNLIAYNNLSGAEDWVHKAAFLASNDSNFYTVAEATQDYVIENFTQPLGYTGIFPNNPMPGGDKLYAARYGAGNSQVVSAINNNRALIAYTGHGSRSSWGTPYLNQSHIRTSGNTGVFNIVASFACITGDFEVAESFGETWMLQPDKGAVGFIGSSASSFWTGDDVLERGMMASLFSGENGANVIGAFRHAGLMAVEANRYGTGTAQSRYYWESYNLLGDPSLEMLIGPKQTDFNLNINPGNIAVCQGGDAAATVGVSPINGFNDPVALSLAGLPAGVSGALSVNPLTPPSVSQLNLSADAGAAPGAYQAQVNGDSGSLHHTVNLGVEIFDSNPLGVTLSTPTNGDMEAPVTSVFTWQAVQSGQAYEIQIALDPAFNQIVFSEVGLTETTYTPPSSLSGSTTYYWRVRASNPCGSSSFSASSQFRTVSVPGDCPNGAPLTELYQTNFDSAVGWSHTGTRDTWNRVTSRSHSPQYAYFSINQNVSSLQRLISPTISLPETYGLPITLKFWQWFNIESHAGGCYDGAILEITSNGGQSWTQIPETALLSNSYTGAISSSYGNPLVGRSAWCGARDWSETVVDLTRYAGQDVALRFTQATDANVGWEGWYLDDISVAACEEKPDYRPYFRNSNVSVSQAPGQQITIRLQLINAGLNPDTYTLTLPEHDWVIDVRTKDTFTLEPDESKTIEIGISIPADAEFGQTQQLQVTATSQNDPEAKDNATLDIKAAIMSYIPLVSKN